MVNGTAGDYGCLCFSRRLCVVLEGAELEGVKHRGRTDELKKELEERNSESGQAGQATKKKWRP